MKSYLAIVGATGCIGRNAVAAAIEADRAVAAIADDADALAALEGQFASADLVTYDAAISDEAAVAALSMRLRAGGRPLDGVIVALGGDATRGRLLDHGADAFAQRLAADLLPQLSVARHLLPLLAESRRGGYVMIAGPGADHAWAGYGQHSVTTAALRMLARVLHDEARQLSVRVQLLGFDSPMRTESNARHACDQWPSVDAIARHAVAMTTGAESPDRPIVHHRVRSASAAIAAARVETVPAQRETRELLRAVISYSRQQDTPSP